MYGTLYFGESTVSHEYLVYKDILVDELKKYNITLLQWYSFERYFNSYDPFFYREKHDITLLDEDNKFASFLYHTFAFIKN
jgi:hypothetical protein